MSKLVNWGRWPVVALFALQGIPILTLTAIRDLIHGLRDGTMVMYPIYLTVMWGVASLLCASGLVKWRHWSYVFALILTTLEIVLAPVILLTLGRLAIDPRFVFSMLLLGGTLIWLLLPPVRSAYSERHQPA